MHRFLALVLAGSLGLSAGAQEKKSVEGPSVAWTHGPTADPAYFPLAVWLQDELLSDLRRVGEGSRNGGRCP